MKTSSLMIRSLALVALSALCACGNDEGHVGPDSCVSSAYSGGSCTSIDTCCTAGKSDCYLIANSRPLPCPDRNCVDPQLLASVATACGVVADGDAEAETADQENAAPPSHTDIEGTIPHKPGKDDPLTNCGGCHGALLTGGTGPSCYACHDNAGHDSSRGGQKHKSGSSADCAVCHGPQNTGGLGPACTACHGH